MKNMTPPLTKVYRYEKICPERINTLKEGKVWCSSPMYFNDLSDCRFELENDGRRRKYTSEFIGSAEYELKDSPLGQSTVNQLIKVLRLGNSTAGFMDEMTAYNLCDAVRKWIVNTTRVCCFFNANPENALMWAHYGDNHMGVCVEYEFDQEYEVYRHYEDYIDEDAHYLGEMKPVNYSSRKPSLTVSEMLFSPEVAVRRVVFSKQVEWMHEKEYRLVFLPSSDVSSKQGGFATKLPSWLKPTKIIVGARFRQLQGEYIDEERKPSTVKYAIGEATGMLTKAAVQLNLPLSQMVEENGNLSIQELRNRN